MRGTATRQKILDAAVEAFTNVGFGMTTLSEIAERAGLTNGALYYHFESKEALAVGIIEEAWPKTWELVVRSLESSGVGLESVIRMAFSLTELLQKDDSVWLSHHLSQAFGQSNTDMHASVQQRLAAFTDAVATTLRPTDIGEGVSPEAVGDLIWLVVSGSQYLARTRVENQYRRLTANLNMLLRSIVPAESLSYFEKFTARTADRFDTLAVG